MGTWFKEGDRVKYLGGSDTPQGTENPGAGELGWVIDADEDVPVLIVSWDISATMDMSDGKDSLEIVDGRREPEPLKRIAGDPFGKSS